MLLHLNMTNIMYDKFSCFTCGYLHLPNIFIDCSHEPALLNGRKNFKSWRKPLNGKHLHKSFYWLLHKKKGVVFSCFQFYALLVPWGLGGPGFQPIITLGRQPAFLDKAPRLSIRIVIWTLPSDTETNFKTPWERVQHFWQSKNQWWTGRTGCFLKD